MNIFLDEHKDLIIQLVRADVDFILVGGYAVIFHGYSRTTGDLDIWLKPDNFNKEKLKAVLSAQGILHEDIERLTDVDFSKPIAFHIGEPPFRVDFLTHLSGLKYDEAEQGAVFFSLNGAKVKILHLNDLIVNKLLSGRTKDKADVEELQKIIHLKRGNE